MTSSNALTKIEALIAENELLQCKIRKCCVLKGKLLEELLLTGGFDFRINANARKSLNCKISKFMRRIQKNKAKIAQLCNCLV